VLGGVLVVWEETEPGEAERTMLTSPVVDEYEVSEWYGPNGD
jgi:hypothetical protein